MPSQLFPRALLIAAVLALAGVPAFAAGKSSGAISIGQSNPGTVDINRTIVSPLGTHAPATAATTSPTLPLATSTGPQTLSDTGAVMPPLQPNTGTNGLPLTATSSGTPVATTSGAIAAPSGTAVLGATGRDMTECMSAWDTKTHMSKSRWREICKSTAVDFDM